MNQPGNFRSGKPVSSPPSAIRPVYKSLGRERDGVWGREREAFLQKGSLSLPQYLLQQIAFPVEEAGTGGRRHRLGRVLLHAGEEGIPGSLKLGAMHRDVQGPCGIDPCVLPIAAGPEAFPFGALKDFVRLDAERIVPPDAHRPETGEHDAERQRAGFRQGQKIFLGQFRADERGAETELRKARQREGIGGVAERPGDQNPLRAP